MDEQILTTEAPQPPAHAGGLGAEAARNLLGFILLSVGVGLVLLGHRVGIDKLSDSGFGFITASALALQVRKAGV